MQENNIGLLVLGALETNCWICPLPQDGDQASAGETAAKTGRPCAVIDPGAEAELIIARMEALNLYPRYILLTHGHFDHLGALPALAARYRPLAETAVHRDDAGCLGPGAYRFHRESFAAIGLNAAYLDSLWEDLPAPGRLLSDGDAIGPFRVVHLPGHTPGSAGFLWGDENSPEGVLFSGDTLFRDGVGRTDLPGGDEKLLGESIRRLFSMDGAVTVLPGHGPATTIGAEKARY